MDFFQDSWVSLAQQVVLLFPMTSAGVTHATALIWKFGWVWDIPDGLTHVMAVGAGCWLRYLCCPLLTSFPSKIAWTSSLAVLFKGAKIDAIRPLKAPAQQSNVNASTAFYWPKQVTSPAQIQWKGK